MKKAWSVLLTVAVILLGLGGLTFGLSLIMGADITRIAAAVFNHYDLAAIIESANGALDSILALFPG